MSRSLDSLLETVREPEPNDEAFVLRVMAEVNADQTLRQAKLQRRRRLRRPAVMGIVAAAVVTGGAVAAVVGTNPGRDAAVEPADEPSVVVTSEEPEEGAAPKARPSEAEASSAAAPSGGAAAETGRSSEHSSFVLDEATGLLLQTEAYTSTFAAGRPQRVTLTLHNTGPDPIAVSAYDGCALQVLATAKAEAAVEVSILGEDETVWTCAGSDAEPGEAVDQQWLLAPDERRTADAFVVLPAEGSWELSGMCRCTYRRVKPTPVPRTDPLSELTRRALPSPLLPEQADGRNLVTPALAVRAE